MAKKKVGQYKHGGSDSLRMRMQTAKLAQEVFPESFGFTAAQRTYIAALLDRKERSQEPPREDCEVKDVPLERVMRSTRTKLGLSEDAPLPLLDQAIQQHIRDGRRSE